MASGGPCDRAACSTPPRACCERWGRAKTTVDDIATEAGISRATLYRMFPGGRDNLFEALRQQETEDFFVTLSESLNGAEVASTTCSCAASSTPPGHCVTTSTCG